MKRYFTPTFTRFVFGFLAIIAIAFGIIIAAASQAPHVAPVDNVALPQ
ncbi:MAG: hypothetical protein Q7S26_00585 [bacterium]|nr:hypothetical protein [bacterium]